MDAHVHIIIICFWFEDRGCHEERKAPLHTLAITSFDPWRRLLSTNGRSLNAAMIDVEVATQALCKHIIQSYCISKYFVEAGEIALTASTKIVGDASCTQLFREPL